MSSTLPANADITASVYNAAGQPALNYRILTYQSSLQRMIARLHRLALPDGPFAGTRPFAKLTTRQSSDPTIALLDSWAMLIDVLAFYQERIANEGFLRTAGEEQSILELLRAIGYELRPAISASTYVVFAVDDTPGSPTQTLCPRGTQVQSVPDSDQLPQTFETLSDLTARVEWNTLRPLLMSPQKVGDSTTAFYLPYDVTERSLQAGEVLYVPRLKRLFTITDLAGNSDGSALRVQVRPGLVCTDNGSATTPAAAGGAQGLLDQVLGGTFSEADLLALAQSYGVDPTALPALVQQQEGARDGEPIFVFHRETAFFGKQAPSYQNLPQQPTGNGAYAPSPPYQDATKSWSNAAGQNIRTIWLDCFGDTYVSKTPEADVYLDSTLATLSPQSLAVFHDAKSAALYSIQGVCQQNVLGYGQSATVTGLKVAGQAPAPTLLVRDSAALVQSEPLALLPAAPVADDAVLAAPCLLLDRLVLGLLPGQLLWLRGEPVDMPFSEAHELCTLTAVRHVNGHTELTFTSLTRRYQLATVTMSANVVFANHGETVGTEVLGSGDGGARNQRFPLSQTGLSYSATSSESGAQSSLNVTVNDVAWHEAPMLYGQAATEACYMLRTDAAGRTTVIFGDGEDGARLPSGQDNVVASYRTGGGPAGEVKAGSLQVLTSAPLGIRSVRNPIAASGAAPRETPQRAQRRAPLSIRPLSRLVSRRDYEDFAHTFAGIDKALGVMLSGATGPLLHLSVAASSGRPLADDSLTLSNLRRALHSLGDPSQAVCLQDHTSVRFQVRARLRIDPDYSADKIELLARDLFTAAFCFAQRELGQPVMAAEVINVLQSVPGVNAVTLLLLHRSDEAPALRSELTAATARLVAGNQARPAELLLADNSSLILEVRT